MNDDDYVYDYDYRNGYDDEEDDDDDYRNAVVAVQRAGSRQPARRPPSRIIRTRPPRPRDPHYGYGHPAPPRPRPVVQYAPPAPVQPDRNQVLYTVLKVIAVAAPIVALAMQAPTPPIATGDVADDVVNQTTYLDNLAKAAKRAEMVHAVGTAAHRYAVMTPGLAAA